MSWLDNIRAKSPQYKVNASMIGSEIAAVGVGQYGPIWAKQMFPKLRQRLINTVSYNFVQPNMELFEGFMADMFKSKEDAEAWAKAKAEGQKARADFMAEHATDIALTFPASFGTALLTKKAIDVTIQSPVSTSDFLIGSLGEGAVHLGGMWLMPKLSPEKVGAFKSGFSKILQKVGMSEEKAEKYAMNFTYSGIPDAVGFSLNLLYQHLRSGGSRNR
jgi:hypothetical protein